MMRVWILGFFLILLAGCGGGSTPAVTPVSGAVLTRASDAGYSEDAKILAARAAKTAWISEDTAKAFDADFTKIRTAYPAVQGIHARSGYALNRILIGIKNSAPFLARWQSGTVLTGNAKLDALLSQYDADQVTTLFAADDETFYLITLAQSLNIPALVGDFARATTDIKSVEPDGAIGDGDDITFAEIGGHRTYTFRQGWGDCPAGCINGHTWLFTMNTDGTVGLVEGGTPLSEAPARL